MIFLPQVVGAARDCLCKSKDGLLTSGYFMDLSENLQRLLYEVCSNYVVVCLQGCFRYSFTACAGPTPFEAHVR